MVFMRARVQTITKELNQINHNIIITKSDLFEKKYTLFSYLLETYNLKPIESYVWKKKFKCIVVCVLFSSKT